MSTPSPTPSAISRRWFAGLVALAIGALALYLWNNDFPLGYHYDEPKKVRFLLTNDQDFQHPLLMLDLVRLVNIILQVSDGQTVAILGRTLNGVAGMFAVVILFFSSVPSLGTRSAFVAAVTFAGLPIVAVHSHYLKEDILLLSTGLAAIAAAAQYSRRPTWPLALGVATLLGLAFSSHYKALLVTIALVPLLRPALAERPRIAAAMALLCGATFVAANWPLLRFPERFVTGVSHSQRHAVVGHFVPIYWQDHLGTFHFTHSLAPGLTWPVCIVATAATIWYTCRFRSLVPFERSLLLYGYISYIVPEVSPLKPPPDFARYVLPVVPTLCYFIAKAGRDIWVRIRPGRFYRLAFISMGIGLLLFPLGKSIGYVHAMASDTREQAREWVNRYGFTALYEVMSNASLEPHRQPWGYTVDPDRLRAQGYTHFVASSFAYEVYLEEKAHAPSRGIRRWADAYEALFARPFHEIRSASGSIGFSNPTIRIVDIREATSLASSGTQAAR